MNRPLQRLIAAGLTVCLLFLSGVVYAQTVEHAAHHAHHQAATHATVLCSWMCAAGQVLEGVEVVFHQEIRPLTFTSLPVAAEPSGVDRPASPSRGPPASSV